MTGRVSYKYFPRYKNYQVLFYTRYFVSFFLSCITSYQLAASHICIIAQSCVIYTSNRSSFQGCLSSLPLSRDKNKASYGRTIVVHVFFFFLHTFTFQLLDKPWSQVGVVPSPPRFLPSNVIAHRVQQSHCSSIVHRVLLTHALALSGSQIVHKKKSQRIDTSVHSAGLELTKLTYTRLEDNLIRHRGDRLHRIQTAVCFRIRYEPDSDCFTKSYASFACVFFVLLKRYFDPPTSSTTGVRVDASWRDERCTCVVTNYKTDTHCNCKYQKGAFGQCNANRKEHARAKHQNMQPRKPATQLFVVRRRKLDKRSIRSRKEKNTRREKQLGRQGNSMARQK